MIKAEAGKYSQTRSEYFQAIFRLMKQEVKTLPPTSKPGEIPTTMRQSFRWEGLPHAQMQENLANFQPHELTEGVI